MKYAHTDNVNIPNAFSPRGVAETLCHVPETSRHRKCVGIIVVAGGNVRITGGINPQGRQAVTVSHNQYVKLHNVYHSTQS